MNEITYRELDKQKIGTNIVVSELLLKRGRFYTEKLTQDRLLHQLESFVWGENLPEKYITFPENWKQAFKERWFPKWLVTKYPIKYTKIEVSGTVLYPDFEPMTDRYALHLKVLDKR